MFWPVCCALPLLLLALAQVLHSLRRRDKSSWLLALAASVTLVFFFLTAGVGKFYPRYVLPAFTFLLILATRSLAALVDWLRSRLAWRTPRCHSGLLAGLVLLLSLPALRFDYLLLTDPPGVPWLPIDRWQYVDGWPSGYGIADASAYLCEQPNQLDAIIVVKRATSEMRAGA